MSRREIPGQLIVVKNAAAAACDASERIASALGLALAARGRASVALSGGNTPREAYATLARAPYVEWGRVSVFWVDERAVPPDDDRSNYRWAKVTLLNGAPIPRSQVHRMPAEEADLDAAARTYETILVASLARGVDGLPVLDIVVLGVGEDGHTASLFPGDPAIDVTDRLVAAVPARLNREARLTLTPPVIRRSRLVIVLAVGSGKRGALERAWAADGDVHQTPSRLVRECQGDVVWIVDEEAAGRVRGPPQ